MMGSRTAGGMPIAARSHVQETQSPASPVVALTHHTQKPEIKNREKKQKKKKKIRHLDTRKASFSEVEILPGFNPKP